MHPALRWGEYPSPRVPLDMTTAAIGTLRLRGSITGREKAASSCLFRPVWRVNAAFLPNGGQDVDVPSQVGQLPALKNHAINIHFSGQVCCGDRLVGCNHEMKNVCCSSG